MSLFGFDPDSVALRLNNSPAPPLAMSLGQSVRWGSVSFGAVSLAVYSVWAFGGGWLARNFGEAGFYAVCAVLFIALSGAALNRLILGPRTLARFYGLFSVAFLAYAFGWCVAWFALRGKAGEWLGSLAGTTLMALVLAQAFSARNKLPQLIVILFVAHSAGYFLGGWIYEWLRSPAGAQAVGTLLDKAGRATAAKLLWGIAHGSGFGAGLGYAFFTCQEALRPR